ncbi:LRR 8 domain containing protein [Asbolus verrucosus]|uniref:LRR 8 domain containing protein n=1 Tax=Asbolus verrucosus TaxID=1661398 RepID=A0A482W0U9_ASBVE|nr:LRR 8 domain containing protein [Asbolus verrucosus]
MYRTKAYLLLLVWGCATGVWGITNNADLIWYEDSGEPHDYLARQPIPEGLITTRKIVVNQKFPILWQVRFAFFDNLETLVIDDCGVNDIKPNTFRDLKPLTNLSLSRNNLRELKEGVFNHVQIKNLNFSSNKISVIAARAFDNMPVLERVVLDFNELRQWSGEWFFNCTNIKTVSITHNFLEELPLKAFRNFWNEEDKEVDVYFSYNKIGRVDPTAFEGAKNFGDLFLDWNDMERINGHALGKLSSIRHLNLNGDSLQCLSEEFMSSVLNKTELLSLRENPLKCECFQELQMRAEKTHTEIEFSQQQTADC